MLGRPARPWVLVVAALSGCGSAPSGPQPSPTSQVEPAPPGLQEPRGQDEPEPVPNDGVVELKAVTRLGGAAWMAPEDAKAVAFSPDGKWAVSGGGEDETLVVWDARTGQPVGALGGERLDAAALAFSPDGKLVAAADIAPAIVLWDVETRQVARKLEAHAESVYRFGFSPDGKLLASGDADGVLLLWDLASGAPPRTLSRKHPSTGELAFTPDGRALAAATDGGIITVWDVASGALARQSQAHAKPAAVHGLAYSKDGKTLVSGETLADGSEAVVLRDAASLAVRQTLAGHTGHVNAVATTPDDALVVSGSGDGSLRVWELATGRARGELRTGGTPVWSLAVSPDGQVVAGAGGGRKIHVFRLATGEPALPPAAHEETIAALAFSPDGRALASGDVDGNVVVRDPASGTLRLRLPKQPRSIATLAWSPDGSRLLTLSDGDGIYWDPATGAELGRLKLGRFDAVVFSPDGRYLVASDASRIVRLLDAKTGAELRTFGEALPHDDVRQNLMSPSSVAFSPDGRELAVARWDQPIHVWAVASGALLRTIPGTLNVAWSPKGDVLASNVGKVAKRGTSLEVRLWDAATGEALFTVDGDTPPRFTPDGRHIVAFRDREGTTAVTATSAGRAPSARELVVWSVATGKLVGRAAAPGYYAVDVSPDGRLLAVGGRDATVLVFDLRGLAR